MKYEEFKNAVIQNLKKDGTYKEIDGDFQTWWDNHDGEDYAKAGFKSLNFEWNKGSPVGVIEATCWNIFMS